MKTFMEMYLECVAGEVIGPTDSGASQFSGDTYAPGDNRTPFSLFGGYVVRRNAPVAPKGPATKKRKKKATKK